MSERWKVVIVGGGFGGLSAARHLNSNLVDVTLIDRRNYYLFQPLLYQVATGSLSPGEIASPLRSVLSRQKNTRVWLGTVVDVDADSKRVFLADGTIVSYDSLIVAAGSQTSYFGHNEWQEWAAGLKSIEEATTIRHKILYAFEVAERISDPEQRRAWLTFVVVGAGPTGVELSGAIAEIARQTLKDDFRSIKPEEAQIILLDGAPRERSRPAVPEQTAAGALPDAECSSPAHPRPNPQTAQRRYQSCAHLFRACEDVPSPLRPATQAGEVLSASYPFQSPRRS